MPDASAVSVADIVADNVVKVEPTDAAKHWRVKAAAILNNPIGDVGQTLRALGDEVHEAGGSVAAAHACYMLSGLSLERSSIESRQILLGGDHRDSPCFGIDAFQATEMYEWSLRSESTTFEYQAIKLMYAKLLFEHGLHERASMYVRSIANASEKRSIEWRSQDVVRRDVTIFRHRMEIATSGDVDSSSCRSFWDDVEAKSGREDNRE